MIEQEASYRDLQLERDTARTWLFAYLRSNGAGYFDVLEETFKFRAKTLHRALATGAPSVKLMQVQEALASALGFPRTHALQRSLAEVRVEIGRLGARELDSWLGAHDKRMAPYVGMFQLGTDFEDSSLPLRAPLQQLLSHLSQALAKALALPSALVQDAVASAWAGADSWKSMLTRTPLTSPLTEPILTFSVEGDPASRTSLGHLHMSKAGHWIWDHVLGSDPYASAPQSAAQARQALNHALSVAERYPELYVAWAAAAGAAQDHHKELGLKWSQVIGFVEEGLSLAQSTWPKGFKGTLSWGHLDNRPFLRMLRQKMDLQLQAYGGLRFARRTARKLSRLSPKDSDLVCRAPLVLGLGAAASTQRRLCNAALKQGDPSSLLHVGVAQVFAGNNAAEQQVGVLHFVESILRVPEFGAALLGDPQIRPYRRYHRPVGYGDVMGELTAVFALFGAYPKFEAWVGAVLRDPDLLAHERRLEHLIETRETGPFNWAKWNEDVSVGAARLAPGLLARNPFSS